MGDLRDLYQEVILDHGRKPRRHHAMDDADAHADGHNPLCGDRITVYVRFDDDRVSEVSFEGSGCAISTASASLMAEALSGVSREEFEAKFRAFHALVTGGDGEEPDMAVLGKLAVFAGVREFPVRIKCATLAWHTIRAAMTRDAAPVSTE
jgi:nitrogen fixation NifU-like protein